MDEAYPETGDAGAVIEQADRHRRVSSEFPFVDSEDDPRDDTEDDQADDSSG